MNERADKNLAELRAMNQATRRTIVVVQGTLQTLADGLEQQAAHALARHFNGRVVCAGHPWDARLAGQPGDLDVCVDAVVNGEPVVILGECKARLAGKALVKAKEQLAKNVDRWQRLCLLVEQGLTGDEPEADDYEPDESDWWDPAYIKHHLKDARALRIRELKDRPIVLALAGVHMPAHIPFERTDQWMRQHTLLRVDPDAGTVSTVDM